MRAPARRRSQANKTETNWPADAVERRSVASLTPYARNARTHSDAQVGQIAASIKEWGWTMPILVDEKGGIIAGHGRVLAAQKLGLEEVPVMVARGWSDAQRKTYVLADNKLALNGGWDNSLLALEIADLKEINADLGLTGFSPKEIDRSLKSLDDSGAATGQLGDLQFRVVVDCTSEEHQAELLQRFEAEGLKCRALIS